MWTLYHQISQEGGNVGSTTAAMKNTTSLVEMHQHGVRNRKRTGQVGNTRQGGQGVSALLCFTHITTVVGTTA